MLPLIALILAATAALTAIVLVLLQWDKIVNWFQNRKGLLESDKDNIAVAIKQALADGKVSYVQGIFNERTNELIEGAKYEAEKLDDETKKHHGENDLIVISS